MTEIDTRQRYEVRTIQGDHFVMIAPMSTIVYFYKLPKPTQDRIINETERRYGRLYGVCDLYGNGKHEDIRVTKFDRSK